MSAAEGSASARSLWKLCAYAAFVTFAVVSFWGAFSPLGEGHLGGGLVGNVMVGENAFRWHQWYPSWGWYTSVAPPEDQWICSHPYGMLWLAGGVVHTFGHSNFAAVAPAIAMSCLTPPLLWSTVRKRFGDFGAACTAWGFVCLPLTMGFAKFQSLEVFVIFGCALFSWGHTHYVETGRGRYALASVVGVWFAGTGDWPGFIYLGALLAWGFTRRFVLPKRLTPRCDRERYAYVWAVSAAAAAAVGLLTLYLLYHGHRVECLLRQAVKRSLGAPSETLFQAFRRRKLWIDASFTPLPVALGKLTCVVAVLRALFFRRDEEVASLAALGMATIQYLAFPQGADVHTFWPHYFALYFAFAFGQLGATVHVLADAILARWAPTLPTFRGLRAPEVVRAFLLSTFLVWVLPDAFRCAFIWRSSGGNWTTSTPMNRELAVVLRKIVRPRVPHGSVVAVDPSLDFGSSQTWAVQRDSRVTPNGPGEFTKDSVLWLARPSALTGAALTRYAGMGAVYAYGDLWMVDRRTPPGPADAYSLGERAPSLLELWLLTETEPAYAIGETPDPFLTWELRHHLGQTPLPTLSGTGSSLDEVRILRNRAVSLGMTADVASFDQRIFAKLSVHEDRSFAPGMTLLGTRVDEFAVHMGEVWVRAERPITEDRKLSIESKVISRARFSRIEPDPTPLRFNVGSSIPTSLWKPGFVYRFRFPMRKRLGIETFSATMGATPVTVETF